MKPNQVIEIENFLTEDEIKFIESDVLLNTIPWFYEKSSTSEKFPFFSHIIIPRCQTPFDQVVVNSPLHDFFTNIQKRFCDVAEIKIEKIYRQCLNLTFPSTEEYGDVHTDHDFDHKNMIMYLNDDYDMGETILFRDLEIIKEIKPKKGKVICFDGKLPHTLRWIPKGRRIIFVSTFN
jgi:hypothetical protein